jgi:hypothetical protein
MNTWIGRTGAVLMAWMMGIGYLHADQNPASTLLQDVEGTASQTITQGIASNDSGLTGTSAPDNSGVASSSGKSSSKTTKTKKAKKKGSKKSKKSTSKKSKSKKSKKKSKSTV